MANKDKVQMRTRFDRRRVSIAIDPAEGRTKAAFKDEVDVNNIVKKYLRTGQLPDLARQNPVYADVSDVPSYQEALEVVRVAEESFLALPAAVRAECGNDPAVFLSRVRDPEWATKHKLALPPQVVDKAVSTGQPGPLDGVSSAPSELDSSPQAGRGAKAKSSGSPT